MQAVAVAAIVEVLELGAAAAVVAAAVAAVVVAAVQALVLPREVIVVVRVETVKFEESESTVLVQKEVGERLREAGWNHDEEVGSVLTHSNMMMIVRMKMEKCPLVVPEEDGITR